MVLDWVWCRHHRLHHGRGGACNGHVLEGDRVILWTVFTSVMKWVAVPVGLLLLLMGVLKLAVWSRRAREE